MVKLKFSNILLNYKEFVKRFKDVGYDIPKYNLRSKTEVKKLFSEFTDDVILFNDMIHVFDYTDREKKSIVDWLNKLNFKKETWLHLLIEKNNEIYSEDESEYDSNWNDMQLFESSFPMSRNELLYVSCLKEAQSSTNFDNIYIWTEKDMEDHDGAIVRAFTINSKLINENSKTFEDNNTQYFIVMYGADDSVSILSTNEMDNIIRDFNTFKKVTRSDYKLKPSDINLFIDKIISTDYQLDENNNQFIGHLVIDKTDYIYSIYTKHIEKNLKTFNNYATRKHGISIHLQDRTDIVFQKD